MRKSVHKTAALILVPLGLFVASWTQVRFTCNYVLGNFHYFVRDDVGRATLYYGRLFQNPNMERDESLAVMFNAYGYGIISRHAGTGEPIAGEDLQRLQRRFPDNIFLNFLASPKKSGAMVENLDDVAFSCLQDPRINALSLRVLSHFHDKGELSPEWMVRLVRFLEWRGNAVLVRNLIGRYPALAVKDLGRHEPAGHISAQGIVRAALKNTANTANSELNKYQDRESRLADQLQTELNDDPAYLALRKRFLQISDRVRELKKTYKMGYPPLAKASLQAQQLGQKLAEMEAKQKESLRQKIATGVQSSLELLETLEQALNRWPDTDTSPRIVELTALPSNLALARELSEPVEWNARLLEDLTFASSARQRNWVWVVQANRPRIGRASYFGERDGDHFRIMGFFEHQEPGQAAGWGGLYCRRRIELGPGLFQVTLTYKTRPHAVAPILWLGRGIPGRKLPMTGDRWMTVVRWFQMSAESDVSWIQPMVRTGGVGETWIHRLTVHQLSEQPFQYVKDLTIVAVETKD
ncbi:MAG: hypothetical protein JXA62_00140 [Candidatus Aminicenantes bacterium]|nr:hypothetical protein [Candidatus Aminicenantes bacterium]